MFDAHFHTDISYCTEGGMTLDFISRAIREGDNLDGIAVTDHSFAVYFPEDVAWSWEYMWNSGVFDSFRESGDERMAEYLQSLKERRGDGIVPGLETEIMHDGRFTFSPEFRKDIDVLIGSVHYLAYPPNASAEEIFETWLDNTMRLINSGIDILGHPFRWISDRVAISDRTIREVVAEAVRNDVVLEFNSHFEIDTDSKMIDEIIAHDAKIAFSTDSHNRNEAGDFSYQLNLLEKKGVSLSDLNVFIGTSK